MARGEYNPGQNRGGGRGGRGGQSGRGGNSGRGGRASNASIQPGKYLIMLFLS